ncbi:MAG: endonuclease domain-containing protein [Chitinophagaceae bacterium]|nr:endonuclease domain-containing protein [Chitinophagaceae bacterium]
MERTMFYKASPLIFEMARELRSQQTHAETILWEYLKTKPSGYKFRRQHPIGIYIVDFYCHKLKLVIEADGSIHNVKEVKEHDKERQIALEENNIKVIRFTNADILNEMKTVIDRIQKMMYEQ